jgi:mannose-6-phosphate isomerase-like protein (cupin superfamily)
MPGRIALSMLESMTVPTSVHPFVVRPGEGLETPLGQLATVQKLPEFLADGRLAIVEHALPPWHLAAPLHRHSREDELSIVVAGQLGARLGDAVVVAGPATYVLKPRGQWHTFWNAGSTELRFIEVLIPGGVEGYFTRLSALLSAHRAPTAGELQHLASEYGIEFDFDSVAPLCEQFGLRF